MPAILALDQGTTSSRSIVFNHAGDVVAMAQQEFTQNFPKPGWVEHDPREIWESQLTTTRDALARSGLSIDEIDAIGITNQRETTMVWDRATGEPIYPAIVWQDRRTAGFCDALREAGKLPEIRQKTGLVLDAYFAGSKLHWLLHHVEGARSRAERGDLCFGTIDSWLIWKLTGGKQHLTDATNASRTLLYDIHEGRWDDGLLALFDVPASMLPEVIPSSGASLTTQPELFGRAIPVTGIAGDQQAALFGQACHRAGEAKNTYGTGCFVLMNTGKEAVLSENQLVTTIAWQIGDTVEYALEGSVFVAGAAIQWLRDQLGIVKDASQTEAMARSVEDNGGVYFVPAFTGLGAPHWDAYARGQIIGLTRGSTKEHVVRAALESIAYQSHDVLRAMESDSGITLRELRVDGGASRNDFLMQFQADILGVPVVRPVVSETTALGAAYLAGLATGFWKGLDDIHNNWKEDARFEPTMSVDERDKLIFTWTRAVDASKGWELPPGR